MMNKVIGFNYFKGNMDASFMQGIVRSRNKYRGIDITKILDSEKGHTVLHQLAINFDSRFYKVITANNSEGTVDNLGFKPKELAWLLQNIEKKPIQTKLLYIDLVKSHIIYEVDIHKFLINQKYSEWLSLSPKIKGPGVIDLIFKYQKQWFQYKSQIDFEDKFGAIFELQDIETEHYFNTAKIRQYLDDVDKWDLQNIILAYLHHSIGFGVFANKAFSKDEFIGMFVGELEFIENADIAVDEVTEDYSRLIVSKYFCLNDQFVRSTMSYMNLEIARYSNVKLVKVHGSMFIFFVAKKPISKGEQLLLNCDDVGVDISKFPNFQSMSSKRHLFNRLNIVN